MFTRIVESRQLRHVSGHGYCVERRGHDIDDEMIFGESESPPAGAVKRIFGADDWSDIKVGAFVSAV